MGVYFEVVCIYICMKAGHYLLKRPSRTLTSVPLAFASSRKSSYALRLVPHWVSSERKKAPYRISKELPET